MHFTLKQIRYFVATAEFLSISKASKELNRSQSAVTNSLSELEAVLNVSLFQRSHKGVELTHEGHQFLISARRILASVSEATNNLQRIQKDVSGNLVIGVTSLLTGYYLSEPLSQFAHRFPKVAINLQEDDPFYIEHQLINGEIDVGILMLKQLREQDAFDTETLISSPLKVWLPVTHPLYEQADISLTELVHEPVISLTANGIDQLINQAWQRYNPPAQTIIRTQSVEAVRNLVGAGRGVAILPDFTYRPWTLDMQLVGAKHIKEDLPGIEIGLVWRKGSGMAWSTSEFIDVARDHSKSRLSAVG